MEAIDIALKQPKGLCLCDCDCLQTQYHLLLAGHCKKEAVSQISCFELSLNILIEQCFSSQ